MISDGGERIDGRVGDPSLQASKPGVGKDAKDRRPTLRGTTAARYYALMLTPAAIDASFSLIFALVTGSWSRLPVGLGFTLVVLVGINLLVSATLIYGPLVRGVERGIDHRTQRRINALPMRSAAWIAALLVILVPVGLMLLHEDLHPGLQGLPVEFMFALSVLYAALGGFLVYFLASAFTVRLKRQLFTHAGVMIPASGGSIRRKLTVVLIVVGLLPLMWLAIDLYFFRQVLGEETSPITLDQALLIDLAASLVIVGMAIVFLPAGFSRPIGILLDAVARVGRGDLSTKAPVTTNDEIGALTDRFNQMLDGLREREQIRETFGRFMNPEIADRVLRHPVDLACEVREATVMFTDITGFTALAEEMPPAETIALLNEYVSVVIDTVHRRNGMIGAFIGDGLLIVFNMPTVDADHAANALRAALDIERAVSGRTFGNSKQRLVTRIGINTGEVVAGTVGTQRRQGFAVLGDAVNLASRLEQLNKDLGTKVLLSARTRALAGDGFSFRDLGEHTIRGRHAAERLFTLDRHDVPDGAAR